MRTCLLLVLCLAAFNASAGVISYGIDRYGNIIGNSENYRYYGDQNGYWILDDVNNTIRSTAGPTSYLNTSLFSVADIVDVTYSNIYSNMWVDVGTSTNYSLTLSGTINGSSDAIRYYGDQNGYWILDDVNNTVRSNAGPPRPLNTSLFSVSDIADVTYTNIYSNMWVDVGTSTNYSINQSGNINGSSAAVRYYGDQNGYWILDDVNNTIRTNSGPTSFLNTSLFSVADILDVTYSNIYSHMWVTVDDGSAQQVSEPSTFALLGLGLAGLCLTLRRRK